MPYPLTLLPLKPIRPCWVAAPDLRTSAQTKLRVGTEGCAPRGPFPSPESLHGLMGQRSRCGWPCPQGGRCEVRGGGWQAKAGDSQGKGDSMKDRQQVDRETQGRPHTWPSETLESRGQWRLCRSHHAVGEKGLEAGGRAGQGERVQVKEAAGRAVVLPPQSRGRWVNTTLDGTARGLRDGEGIEVQQRWRLRY